MILVNRKPVFADERGEITDIIENESFDSLTLLSTRKGTVRGNHFHKETTQYTYVLEGACRYLYQKPGEATASAIVRKGDLIVSPPLERHAFEALEDSVLLAFCKGPRGGTQYESDTFRLEELLAAPAGGEGE